MHYLLEALSVGIALSIVGFVINYAFDWFQIEFEEGIQMGILLVLTGICLYMLGEWSGFNRLYCNTRGSSMSSRPIKHDKIPPSPPLPTATATAE
jgi:fucose 4-O-acetylase-like acetyltransferase